MEAYLDNAATTRVSDAVMEKMNQVFLADFGNPSSMHKKGMEAEQYIRYAKETLARILKVTEKEIFFTGREKPFDDFVKRKKEWFLL